MSGSVEMDNVFLPENEVGMWHWLFGKSVTSIVFRNPGPNDGFVGIAAPSLARILPVGTFNSNKIIEIKEFLYYFLGIVYTLQSQRHKWKICNLFFLLLSLHRLIWQCLVERFYAR